MSLTDDISSQIFNKAESGVPQLIKAGAEVARTGVDTTKNLISGAATGIVLVIKGPFLTSEVIMKAVGHFSHNPKFSNRNVSIQELEKNSDIKKVDEALTKDAMKHFDTGCKKYGVQYNAIVDKSDPKNPVYYVFFKGKETDIINQVMKESYDAYVKEQAAPKISVKARLAFFRNKNAIRDKEQQDLGKERKNNRADRQR